MATGTISIDTNKAIGYAAGITAKAGPLGSSKHAVVSAYTTMPANTKCAACFNTNNSMLAIFAGVAKNDAAKIKTIAQSFVEIDKKAANIAVQAGKTK